MPLLFACHPLTGDEPCAQGGDGVGRVIASRRVPYRLAVRQDGGKAWEMEHEIDFGHRAPTARPLDATWIHGSPSAKHNTDPDIQVHAYDEHTYILRQNKAVHYEAPFLFLLFGNERAVLIDTGATEAPEHFPLRRVVDGLIGTWRASHPRDRYRLLVLHTHGHSDHVAADGQFADRPETDVIPAGIDEAWTYLGLAADPDRTVRLDLGGRVLECLATPGHHEAAVTYYDPCTGILLTGDTVYRGRLYVDRWDDFRRTVHRLADFADTHPVTHVLGCHIEMSTTPGRDYPVRTTYQPEEPPLEMTAGHLRQLRDAVDDIAGREGVHVYDDFIVHNRQG
ncbi:MBL fold metallo-hydrolase [Streptomyces sp. NPDC020801]|uniref:MBL fold metallo-hydrolase n=1 Tax=unclassified Streptomyces TaxID=2593676 RepID=UPI0037B9C1A1